MSPQPSPRVLVGAGAVGAALVTAASYWVGATPYRFRVDPPAVVDLLRPGAPAASVLWYLGVGVMAVAWLLLGRRIVRSGDVAVRTVQSAGAAAVVPVLVAVPLMSRDLWSYATQARIAAAGLDPYTVTPNQFADASLQNVSARWLDSPSPYGPLWTVIGRAIAAVTGDHLLLQVLVLRLPEVVGFALLAWVVPGLARRLGTDPALATWLVVASPMVVLHGVGGGHNDTLMIGLLTAGLAVAAAGGRTTGTRSRALLAAGLLVGLAAAVKIPAVIAAPFLPLLWARVQGHRPRPVDLLTGLALSAAGAVVGLALPTLAAGRGLAWLDAANTAQHGGSTAVVVALAAVLVVVWLLALRFDPVLLLAVALFAPLWISDLSLAWYWLWPLVPVALVVARRRSVVLVAVLAAGQLLEVLQARPGGPNFALWPFLAVFGVAAGAVTAVAFLQDRDRAGRESSVA